MKRVHTAGILLLAWLVCVPAAAQVHWVENPDAGDLPGTAQMTKGKGPLESISGKIDSVGDVDMFCMFLKDPSKFQASTVKFNQSGALIDTQLFLFNSNGIGLVAADDVSKTNLRTELDTKNFTGTLKPGMYFLAISAFDQDPLSKSGYIFQNGKFVGEVNATGPGAKDPVTKWSTTGFDFGTYKIDLQGAMPCVTTVPEAASLTIFGVCALTFLSLRRVQRRKLRKVLAT